MVKSLVDVEHGGETMKNKLYCCFLALALVFPSIASGYTTTTNGVEWSYSVSDGIASISGMLRSTSGVVEIPTELDGYPVMSIREYAFCDCTNLTSVTIPNGVTSIGHSAFAFCTSLTSVTIPNSVTNIETSAFEFCSGLRVVTIPQWVCAFRMSIVFPSAYRSIESVMIPDGVTSIGNRAFDDCSGLTSVTIPNSVTNIGYKAFYGCSGLTSVVIGSGVTSIGQDAFFGCSGLRNVTIPQCVCTNRMSIVFPSAYQSITRVTIPDSVTNIWSSAFSGCIGLKEVAVPQCVFARRMSDVFPSAYQSITNVIISGSVVNIGREALKGCIGLTSVTIPDGVTRIGGYAFSGCSGLTSITIPGSVTSIGEWGFYGCTNLTSVHTTDIAKWCGISCGSSGANPLSYAHELYLNGVRVTDLVIPDSVTSIGDYAFEECTKLTSVTIPNSVTNIGYRAFRGCRSLTNVTIPDSVMSIGGEAFGGCIGLTSITLPFVGSRRGNSGMSGLLGEVFGSIVDAGTGTTETIQYFSNNGGNCYYIPTALKTVTITDETVFGYGAFYNCSGFTSVTIPDSLTSIGDYAFYSCSGLTGVTIPDSVTNIGYQAFSGCSGLMSISVGSGNAYYKTVSGLLLSKDGRSLVAVPGGLTSVTIPNGVTSIGNRAFYRCTGLTSVTIPNSVTNIGEGVFSGCSGLTNVVIPDSVTSIGPSAFSCCSGLTSITLPFVGSRRGNSRTSDSLFGYIFGTSPYVGGTKVIQGYSSGSSDYYIPTALKTVTITDETVFGYGAFSDCEGLTGVTILGGLTSIGERVFSGCSGLTSVMIGISVTNIGSYAFCNCTNLTSVTIPESVMSIGGSAFSGCANLTNVTMLGEKPSSSGSYALFRGCPAYLTIYVTSAWPSSITTWQERNVVPVTANQILLSDAVSDFNGVSLSWHNISWAETYRIYRGETNVLSSAMVLEELPNSGNCAYLDNTGDVDVEYWYWLEAERGEDSVVSNPVTGRKTMPVAVYSTITYENLLGATNPNPTTYREGTLLSFENPGAVTGYTFAGWTPSQITPDVTGAQIVRAAWAANSYSIAYNPNGGSGTMNATTATYDSEATVASNGFTWAGHLFTGWATNATGVVVYEAGQPVTNMTAQSDVVVTLYAVWEEQPVWSPITYENLRGASNQNPTTYREGTLVSFQNPGAVTGYTFAGWTPSQITTDMTGAQTVRASWTANQYTVTFDANGGAGGTSARQDYGSSIFAPTVTRTGYTFRGWSPTVAATVPASDVTFTAQWIINHYMVTLNPNGGSLSGGMIEYDYGSRLGQLPQPSRTGCIFKGWYSSPTGGEMVEDNYTVLSNTTLYARWQVGKPQIFPAADMMFTNETQSVFMRTTAPDAAMRYTLDGSEPTETSELFEGLFAVSNTCTIKAIAHMDGCEDSDVSSIVLTKDVAFAEEPDFVFTTDGNYVYYDWEGYPVSLGNGGWIVNDANDGGNCNMNGFYRGEPLGEDAWRTMSLTLQGAGTLRFRWSGSCNGSVRFIVDSVLIKGYGMSFDNYGIPNSGDETFDEIITLELVAGAHNLQWVCSCSLNRAGSSYCNIQVSDIKWYTGGAGKNATMVSADVSGDGIVVGGGIYETGTNVALIAIAEPGFKLVGWSGDIAGTTSVVELLANEDKHVVAMFERAPDPIPELPENVIPAQVAAALAGSGDAELLLNVTNAAQYAAYRTWALSVTNGTTTAQTVKESTYAWLSFALAANRLVPDNLTSDDIKIESFEQTAEDGKFAFEVSIADVGIGEGVTITAANREAIIDNLKKVIGVEGAVTLDESAFSSNGIEVIFDVPANGKARITAQPPANVGDSFFMRVKVK